MSRNTKSNVTDQSADDRRKSRSKKRNSKTKRTRKSAVKKTKKIEAQTDQAIQDLQEAKTFLNEGQLAQVVRENSFLLNPITQNNWFEKSFEFEAQRMQSTQWLHGQIFDPAFLTTLKGDTVVNLYSTMLKDIQHQKSTNLKIVELKENNRVISGIAKAVAEQESRMKIAQTEKSHIDTFMSKLLDESLRYAMEDQQMKQIGGSNSYRPPENKNFEIIVKDANADE